LIENLEPASFVHAEEETHMNATDAIPTHGLPGDPVLARPLFPAGTVKPDDPAERVMTDFRQVTPLTVDGGTPIDDALQYMIHAGVRLLFAVDSDSRLIGLITTTDIQGEKPIQHMAVEHEHGARARREIRVRDIMTPVAAWDALDYEALRHATVAQFIPTFKAAGRRHLLVVERSAQAGQCIVRGVISASRLERELGLMLEVPAVARSFTDIEQALAHP
jgi:CBS domain containing-hemolysin-like protein